MGGSALYVESVALKSAKEGSGGVNVTVGREFVHVGER